MNWRDFFEGFSGAFGDRAPLLVFGVLGLAGFVFVAKLFVNALGKLTEPLGEVRKDLVSLAQPIKEIPKVLETHRVEFREAAEAHRMELRELARAGSEMASTMRSINDEVREQGRINRESTREIMRGIERIVLTTIQKMRGEAPC